eukprot:TRINITY_DN8895_c0_g3_i1.p1 TRINITY_DN8895_c0_g3~~TRINITY_DN8895_c0_g3_i1.p1  ORF type:complete len:584 (+),score=145.03 TRINITY_DN8895_c0_g3_i1:1479-3230(+)
MTSLAHLSSLKPLILSVFRKHKRGPSASARPSRLINMLRLSMTAMLAACVSAAMPTPEGVALQKAVYNRNVPEVLQLLEKGTKQTLDKEYGGQSCLMIASYKGDIELCKLLLKHGNPRIDAVGKVGDNEGTALLFALVGLEEKLTPGKESKEVEETFARIVALLVEYGTPLGSKDNRARSPMHIAAATRSVPVIHELLKHKNAPKALARRIKEGPFTSQTPLHLLVDSPKLYVHVCTYLIRGYNTNKEDPNDRHSKVAWHLGDGRSCSLDLLKSVRERSADLLEGVLGGLEGSSGRETVLDVLAKTDIASYLIRHGEHNSLEVLKRYGALDINDERYKEQVRIASIQGHTYGGTDSCDEGVPTAVDVVTDIDKDTFLNEYYGVRKPLILRGAAGSWGCAGWDVEHMLGGNQAALNSTVTVAEIPYSTQYGLGKSQMPLSQYIEEHMKHGSHMYAFDNGMHTSAAADVLRSSYGRLVFLGGAKNNPPQWSFGADGSGSPPHLHQDAVNGVCFGQKEWLIWPPAATFLSTVPAHEFYKPIPAWAGSPIKATQLAGDLLYIPEGWGHAVLNVGPTLGVATEYYRSV